MAGYCLGLLPQASDYGGANRPPVALFATASPVGLKVTMSLEGRHESLASQEAATLGFPRPTWPESHRETALLGGEKPRKTRCFDDI